MNSSTQLKASVKNSEKRSYTMKHKLFPSILLSLAFPLTVGVFGPFDIYLANMGEFRYSLTDKILGKGLLVDKTNTSHKLLFVDNKLEFESKMFGSLAAHNHTLGKNFEIIHHGTELRVDGQFQQNGIFFR